MICHDGLVTGRIVVVGEALVDLVIQPDGTVAAALGGAPFNTARTCGRLGASVSFVGALSNDRFGRLLRARLEADGVDVASAPEVDHPTTLAAAELDERGAASYRFYLEGTSAPSLRRVDASDATFVYTGGLALVLEPMADAVAAMLRDVAALPPEERPLVMVDVNARPHVIVDRQRYLDRLWEVLAMTDVVKVSDDDLEVVCPGIPVLEAARGLLELGPSVVLLTAGADEVVVFHRSRTVVGDVQESAEEAPAPDEEPAVTEHRVPVTRVDVVDTIGAGDSFGGAFAAWWVRSGLGSADLRATGTTGDGPASGPHHTTSEHLLAAVRAGIAVAGIVCGRQGADPPTVDELRQRAPEVWPGSP